MDEIKKGKTEEEIIAEINANEHMSPQEKAHARFFNHGVFRANEMDKLTLDAWIEELSAICFEGRSTLGGATKVRDERKRTPKDKGFERSLNTDPATTNAINIIKERQRKLTKVEKIQEGLKSLYAAAGVANPEAESARIMSARTMLPVVNKAANSTPLPAKPSDGKAVFNPFLHKKQQEQNVKAAIDSIVNGKTTEPQAPIVGKIVNPFDKKANG